MIVSRLLAFLVALLCAWPALTATEDRIEVWRSPTCQCCGKWVEHLEASGFAVTVKDAPPSLLNRLKHQAGIGKDLASCHTGKTGPYVIEGHVPASDIERLLAERPDAIGLTVPGMPIGSPGMERGDQREPYEVLLIKKDGTTEVFARY